MNWYNEFISYGEFKTIWTNHIDEIGMQEVEEWYNKNSSNTSLCELMEFIESQVEKY
jgi:hypothetical protein